MQYAPTQRKRILTRREKPDQRPETRPYVVNVTIVTASPPSASSPGRWEAT